MEDNVLLKIKLNKLDLAVDLIRLICLKWVQKYPELKGKAAMDIIEFIGDNANKNDESDLKDVIRLSKAFDILKELEEEGILKFKLYHKFDGKLDVVVNSFDK